MGIVLCNFDMTIPIRFEEKLHPVEVYDVHI